jgi:hypothetical protein
MARFEITWLEDRSDEAVLAEIRRVAARVPDCRLTKDKFDSLSTGIKSEAVRKRFGSWGEAARRAGLAHTLPDYSDAAIIGDLKRVSEAYPNEPFTIEFYSTQGRYSPSCIKRRLGGRREALGRAEIGNRFLGPPTTERMKAQPGRAMSNEEIIARIRAVSASLDKASLCGSDITENSEITQDQLFRRFGGVSAALKQAGISQARRGRRYTVDEVFENLLKVWTHYGRPPTVSEMDRNPSAVGSSAYIHRYGGWRKALKAFMDRANSEIDGAPPLDPEENPSKLAKSTGPTEGPMADSTDRRKPRPASQARALPRVTGLTPTSVKPPENRREPSIGLRFKVLRRDRFKCVLCGDHPARNAECVLHVDHLIPWSKGGRTQEDNLRTLCATCNIGRGNRFYD